MSLTKHLALDVECVGIKGGKSQAARVSVVNEYLQCVLDTYVAPTYPVVDYRTPVSGIRRHNLIGAPNFSEIREKVKVMLKGRILVGHSLEYDLEALDLTHPDSDVRDTAAYPPFVKMNCNKTPSLRWLATKIIKKSIQKGEHSSVEDAKATMQIFKKVEKEWKKESDKKNGTVTGNGFWGFPNDGCNDFDDYWNTFNDSTNFIDDYFNDPYYFYNNA